jgi:IS5 family transposase
MFETGLFDWQERLQELDKNGDPLLLLNKLIPWENFRSPIEKVRTKKRKNNSGPKGYEALLMFKILILQSLYNLSDDATEFQVMDRISFMRFLEIGIGDSIPDAKTIWLFREQITKAGIIEELFYSFDSYLQSSGFSAKKGQIVDASIVKVPIQRNSRKENEMIKQGEKPDNWGKHKERQKDLDARWVKKRKISSYGYKNHINIDVENKFIRAYEVTDASVHDSNVIHELLEVPNSSRDVWADSAYRSNDIEKDLKEAGHRPHIQRKGYRGHNLTNWERQGNHTRSKTRSRVEHIFGVQTQVAGNLILRSIGIIRAKTKIGLRNLAYNLNRYKTLVEMDF